MAYQACRARRTKGSSQMAANIVSGAQCHGPQTVIAHLGRCLAHLDQIFLHFRDHLIQNLFGVFRRAHCGRGARDSGLAGRQAAHVGASGHVHAYIKRASSKLPLTQLIRIRLHNAHDAREQVRLDNHGLAGGVPPPRTRCSRCNTSRSISRARRWTLHMQ